MRASLVPNDSHNDSHNTFGRRHIARAAIVTLISASLLLSACGEELGPRRALLEIAAGDGQHALVGTELPELIIVQLLDVSQRPLAGVRVTWAAQPGASDVISPASEMTDAYGEVSARWRLDHTTGAHIAVVTADLGASARVTAVAEQAPNSQVHPLSLVTYDGSGQAVHPDFARVPPDWNGDPHRLVATPYPGGNASYENPSLYTGSTGTGWTVPGGLRNPLEMPPDGSYLSDPDMVYDADRAELRIYYRRVTNENEIWMIRSSNGIAWSAPVLTLRAPNHMIVSPTIVRRSSTEWLMWSVNSGAAGCGASSTSVELRRSRDGIAWSSPEATALAEADGFPWHIDVEWIPSRAEYWAVYPVKRAGGCTTDRLRFATSPDGVHWTTYPSPLLMSGASDELHDVVYRSSVDVDATTGVVSLWYSGARLDHGSYDWHLAWERTTIDVLLARVNAPASAAARIAAEPSVPLPQLTNETAP